MRGEQGPARETPLAVIAASTAGNHAVFEQPSVFTHEQLDLSGQHL